MGASDAVRAQLVHYAERATVRPLPLLADLKRKPAMVYSRLSTTDIWPVKRSTLRQHGAHIRHDEGRAERRAGQGPARVYLGQLRLIQRSVEGRTLASASNRPSADQGCRYLTRQHTWKIIARDANPAVAPSPPLTKKHGPAFEVGGICGRDRAEPRHHGGPSADVIGRPDPAVGSLLHTGT